MRARGVAGRTWVAGLLLVALAGCGQDPDPGGPEPGTSLVVTVVASEGGEPRRAALECPGGDAAACDALATLDLEALEPVPADQVCTEIYGGPETATLVGTIDGEAIDASLERTNGCEIDRWTRAEPLLSALDLA